MESSVRTPLYRLRKKSLKPNNTIDFLESFLLKTFKFLEEFVGNLFKLEFG